MSTELSQLLAQDLLFVLIAAGWAILILAGIEPDAPLSGGIPGHVDLSHHEAKTWTTGDRVGELGSWLVFAAVCLSLPLILVWIFRVHGA